MVAFCNRSEGSASLAEAILFRRNRVLLCRNASRWRGSYWLVPGPRAGRGMAGVRGSKSPGIIRALTVIFLCAVVLLALAAGCGRPEQTGPATGGRGISGLKVFLAKRKGELLWAKKVLRAGKGPCARMGRARQGRRGRARR